MLDKKADTRNDELLRAKLNRLLRVKDELWQDCLPVPPELEAMCVRATAVDPGQRFANARELHDAIERYLDGDRDLERRQESARAAAERAIALADAALAGGAQSVSLRTQEARHQSAIDALRTVLEI